METERITLKKFNKNDFDLLFQVDKDPEVMKYLTIGKPSTFMKIKKNNAKNFKVIY